LPSRRCLEKKRESTVLVAGSKRKRKRRASYECLERVIASSWCVERLAAEERRRGEQSAACVY